MQEALEEAKKGLSEDFDLMIDVNCGWNVEQASEFCEMVKDLNIRWLEEPCNWWDDIHFNKNGNQLISKIFLNQSKISSIQNDGGLIGSLFHQIVTARVA